MSEKKFSHLELEQLVREGFGVSDIARKLGVSKGTVSKRLKSLKVAVAKNVTLHHAGEIVEKKKELQLNCRRLLNCRSPERSTLNEDEGNQSLIWR
jgi:Mn-dependent DtxR family transcriptional regulator